MFFIFLGMDLFRFLDVLFVVLWVMYGDLWVLCDDFWGDFMMILGCCVIDFWGCF